MFRGVAPKRCGTVLVVDGIFGVTLVAKNIRVAREAKGTWRVVFWSSKDFGAAEVARRSELHAERHFYLEKAAPANTRYL